MQQSDNGRWLEHGAYHLPLQRTVQIGMQQVVQHDCWAKGVPPRSLALLPFRNLFSCVYSVSP